MTSPGPELTADYQGALCLSLPRRCLTSIEADSSLTPEEDDGASDPIDRPEFDETLAVDPHP
jgi:hypothetical protein